MPLVVACWLAVFGKHSIFFMKKIACVCLLLLAALACPTFAFVQMPPPTRHSQMHEKREALSDIDIMCIMNAADLCSYYDECDLEERQALLNRLYEQTDILSERISMMSCLTKHLETGDHKHLEQVETDNLKSAILETVKQYSSSSSSAPVAP